MVLRNVAFSALLICNACADRGDFPSLARRPVEQAGLAPPTPAPVVPTDPELQTRITYELDRASEGVAAFDISSQAATAAVARGGTSGSESWIAAQLAVTRLEATLDPARKALSALDAERSGVVAKGNTADLMALEAAISEVEDIDRRQSDTVRTLIDALNR